MLRYAVAVLLASVLLLSSCSEDGPSEPETKAIAGFSLVRVYQGIFVCSTNAPCTVRVLDASIGGRSWRYDFGDGSSQLADDEPLHDFVESGIYTVTQRVCPTPEFDFGERCDSEQARITVP